MKKVWILATCMTLLLLLGGCRKGQEMETIEEGVYEIYYLNTAGTRLVPMKYQPAAGEEDKGALIEELMQQLGQVPADFDGQTALGEKIQLQRYMLDGAVLYLYFDPNYMLMNPTREILGRAALTKVFTQIPGIEYINIYSGDQPIVDARGNPVGMMCAADFVESISDVNGFEESELVLYFTDENGEVLKAEKRQVIHSINTSLERLVIEELISGPSQEGLMPTLPAETKLLNISTTENICYINFDSGFLQNTLNVKEYIPVYSIVNSLVENTDVNRVQISINGANDGLLKDIFPLNRLFEQNQDYIAAEE